MLNFVVYVYGLIILSVAIQKLSVAPMIIVFTSLVVSRKKPGLFNLRGYHFFEVCSHMFIFLTT